MRTKPLVRLSVVVTRLTARLEDWSARAMHRSHTPFGLISSIRSMTGLVSIELQRSRLGIVQVDLSAAGSCSYRVIRDDSNRASEP